MELPRDKIKKLKIAFNEAIEIDRFGERTEANESYKQLVLNIYVLFFV